MADLQHDALVRAGVLAKRIYEDRASGKRDDRPNLDTCLKSLRQGDVLVVWKLDRLGRNLRHLVNTVQDLADRESTVGKGNDRLTYLPYPTGPRRYSPIIRVNHLGKGIRVKSHRTHHEFLYSSGGAGDCINRDGGTTAQWPTGWV